MNPMTSTLSAERLKQVLSYDEVTGVFRWRVSPSSRVRAGDVAGGRKGGYIVIRIDGTKHYAHRLAWLYTHGSLPIAEIDHINGDHGDNRLINLRDVSPQVNKQNIRVSRHHSKTGVLGVFPCKRTGKFIAAIGVDGRQVWIGKFPTAERAHEAYVTAKREAHQGSTL